MFRTAFRSAAPLMSSALIAVLTTGCGGSTAPNGTDTKPVGLKFTELSRISGSPVALSGSVPGAVVVANGPDTLRIDLVKMTLEDIDLERTSQSVDCSVAGNRNHNDCSDYFRGPLLVVLDLNGSGQTAPLNLEAPVGTFSKVSFDISVPDGGDPHQEAYLAANPDMRDVSLRITGTFNGSPFSFALDLTGDQIITLNPPLVVTEAGTGFNITVAFDIASWFVRADGSIMNPSLICSDDVGCADRTTVEQNIERSIESYSDR